MSPHFAKTYYEATVERTAYPARSGRTDAQVCILGGGLAGLSTALGLAAHPAPFSKSDSALALVRVKTVAEKPLSIRCPHILRPITPVPIQPIFVFPGAMLGAAMVNPPG